MDAIATLDALNEMVAAGVVRDSVDKVEARLVDGDGVAVDTRMPMSAMQGSSATAQQSQSTDMFFMTLT